MANVRFDNKRLVQILQQQPDFVDEVLRESANEIMGDIVLSFGTSPPGREYQRGKVVHVASRPGNPPNVDTGALRASMRVRKVNEKTYHVQDGVEYGIMLEDGTERMGARPFVRPVFEQWVRGKFVELVARSARRRGLL